ncbi:hypothetical protein HNP11_004197 [Tsukamurella ocularis]|nr:hypothetical protein [Tsukamurella ocularis]
MRPPRPSLGVRDGTLLPAGPRQRLLLDQRSLRMSGSLKSRHEVSVSGSDSKLSQARPSRDGHPQGIACSSPRACIRWRLESKTSRLRNVGYGKEICTALDSTLARHTRLRALGVCVRHAQPLGFAGTWSYLEATVGADWRSDAFLDPAAALMSQQWMRHQTLEAQYAAIRREQKATGLRVPRPFTITARIPARWHGDERLGAFHCLKAWSTRHLTVERVVYPAVAAAVQTVLDLQNVTVPVLAGRVITDLDGALDRSRATLLGTDVSDRERAVAQRAEFALGQLYLIAAGTPKLGVRWEFTC